MANDTATLSFVPAARKTKLWGRLTGLLLIVGAVLGAYALYEHDVAHYPALTHGAVTTGILNGFVHEHDGAHGVVLVVDSGGAAKSITTAATVSGDRNDIGRAYTVHHLGTGYSTVFIDGIDQVKYTTDGYATAGAALLVGLILQIIPFKVRCRR